MIIVCHSKYNVQKEIHYAPFSAKMMIVLHGMIHSLGVNFVSVICYMVSRLF